MGLVFTVLHTIGEEIFNAVKRRDRAWSVETLSGALADADPLDAFMSERSDEGYTAIASTVLGRFPAAEGIESVDFRAAIVDAIGESRLLRSAPDDSQIDGTARVFRRFARRR